MVWLFQQAFFPWSRKTTMTRLVMAVNVQRSFPTNSLYLVVGTERADKKTGKNCSNNPQKLYSSQEVYSSNRLLHQEQEGKPCQFHIWRQIDWQAIRVWWLLLSMPFSWSEYFDALPLIDLDAVEFLTAIIKPSLVSACTLLPPEHIMYFSLSSKSFFLHTNSYQNTSSTICPILEVLFPAYKFLL